MKRLVSNIAGGALAFALLVGPQAAQADPTCVGQDIYCQYSYQSTEDNPNYLVDLTNALLPPSIFALGPHSPQTGEPADALLGIVNLDTIYLVLFDGNDSNPDPLDGYLGISGRDLDTALLGIVFNRSGDFDRFHSGNTPLIQLPTPRLEGTGIPTVLGHIGLPIGIPPFGTLPQFRIPAVPGPIPIQSPNLVLGGKLF